MIDLREETKNIFNETIKFCDTADATKRSVKLEGNQLEIEGRTYDLKNYSSIYSVALGKAAFEMAQALDEILGSSLSAGVVSGNRSSKSLSSRWTKFYGGHPLPNEDSIESAKAAFKLLDKADEKSLVIFLVSGGGSAMIELPAEDYITLDEIRKTNELLVSCGAHISEVNSIRKTLSAIKGGGLSFRAKESTQISLLVSDTRKGEEAVIASGPTIVSTEGISPVSILKKYKLDKELPSNVIKAVLNSRRSNFKSPADHKIVLLMDNESALSFAAAKARESGFTPHIATDIMDQDIAEGCGLLISRLKEQHALNESQPVAVLSGGEFSCPVRGRGRGGRNTESALRLALEMNQIRDIRMVALCAGTDGVDGNSLAAGAIADNETCQRAAELNLDPEIFLAHSDSCSFFEMLGDGIFTGPTGTNVRDIRIVLAK